jgi:hypothetical protein
VVCWGPLWNFFSPLSCVRKCASVSGLSVVRWSTRARRPFFFLFLPFV